MQRIREYLGIIHYEQLKHSSLTTLMKTAVTRHSSHTHLHHAPRLRAWWRIFKVDAFRSEGRGFESRSKRHVGTLGESFTCTCLERFGVLTPTQCQLLWSERFLKVPTERRAIEMDKYKIQYNLILWWHKRDRATTHKKH